MNRKLCLLGNRFGKLTVKSEIINDSGQSKWLCKCDCGKEHAVLGWYLTGGTVKSCGCLVFKSKQPGTRYGKWKLIEYVGNEKWKCKCACGTVKIILTVSLNSGCSKSCGCSKSPKKEIYDERVKKRLKSRVKINENGCWEWQGGLNWFGYAITTYRKETGIFAHRLSYRLWKGKFEDKLLICHHCDNKKCINPDHLFVGTHQDNMTDMVLKRRKQKELQCLTN